MLPAAVKFAPILSTAYMCGAFFVLAHYAKRDLWSLEHGRFNPRSDEHLRENALIVLGLRCTGIAVLVTGIIVSLRMG
jgi:hypothetical protein